jgi:hypothetical protein
MTNDNPFAPALAALPAIIGYAIIDRQTGEIVGKARTRRAASASVDRRDNAYGAYRYFARPILAPFA